MNETEATLPAGGVQWILELGIRAGGDRNALLAQAGLRAEDLQMPDSRIPRQQNVALWRAISGILDDPTLPVRLGQQARPESLGVLGYLIQHVGALGDLFEMIDRFQKLTNSGAPIRVERTTSMVYIGQRLLDEEVGLRYPPEFIISSFTALIRNAVGDMWSPHEVFLQHSEVPWVDVCRRVFRCPVRFDAADSGIAVDTRDLDLRLPTSNPYLLSYLEETAELYRYQPPPRQPWISRILRRLANSEIGKEPNIEEMSRMLGVGLRTLQRRLRDEGVCYRDLLDRVRVGRAQRLLTLSELSVSEVAAKIGYADAGAFTRAFRRSVGETPSAFQHACAVSFLDKHSS